MIVAGAALLVLSGGSILAGKLLLVHYTGDITRSGGLGDAAAATTGNSGKSIEGPINLLLVGTDERPDDDNGGTRADAILVAHVPASHDAVYLTSIPRDSRVTIPADTESGFEGGVDKVNAAFQYGSAGGRGRAGGVALLAETVSRLTGGKLKFNGAAVVNFDGLKDLVKAVGGVRMYVDEKVTSIHVGQNVKTGRPGVPYVIHSDGTPGPLRPSMRPQVYEVGYHEFTDWQALDYVRQRDLLENGDGDYGRQRHQQQFLRAVMEKATSAGVLTSPLKVNAALKSLNRSLTFFNNDVDITDWVFTLKGVRPDAVTMIKANAGRYNSVNIDGRSFEEFSDDGVALLELMVDDNVASFVDTHPDWVGDRPGGTGNPAVTDQRSPDPTRRR
jgi:anionic cell wall polymer biosynthesis LytR-Cps2A-Psr (LCP) family protein